MHSGLHVSFHERGALSVVIVDPIEETLHSTDATDTVVLYLASSVLKSIAKFGRCHEVRHPCWWVGTRLSEETQVKPKPMIEIGGRPILWHIMKIYSAFGVNDFIVCCGYKGYMIKEYFANYALHMSDVTFDMSNNSVSVHQRLVEPWKVTLVDTGEDSNTGGRLQAVSRYIKDEDAFCFTYGDGLADVDIGALLKFHQDMGGRRQ